MKKKNDVGTQPTGRTLLSGWTGLGMHRAAVAAQLRQPLKNCKASRSLEAESLCKIRILPGTTSLLGLYLPKFLKAILFQYP